MPDKKVDSFYCYGVEKTKEIVTQSIRLDYCDSVSDTQATQIENLNGALSTRDSVIAANKTAIDLFNLERGQWQEKEAGWKEKFKLSDEERKRQSKNSLGFGLGFAGSLLFNAITTTALILRK